MKNIDLDMTSTYDSFMQPRVTPDCGTSPFIGDSAVIKKLRLTIRKIALFPRPVLIRGERGVGKELVAHMLHNLSPRAGKRFVVVNSGGVAFGLMASEIFGHEKGSFTSSTARRIGKLEEADGGTLFFDEIGNMPMELQKMLLRVIEYQQFERVGGSHAVKVDVRIIAATNVDLEAAIRKGEFLADLYDRIKYAEIIVPLLRERKDDIPDLARHFLDRLCVEMPWLSARSIGDDALVQLTLRPWPGNIRELRSAIETAAVQAEGDTLRAHHLPPARSGDASVDSFAKGFRESVDFYENKLLCDALDSTANAKAAARKLDLGYDQFRRLLKKHRL